MPGVAQETHTLEDETERRELKGGRGEEKKRRRKEKRKIEEENTTPSQTYFVSFGCIFMLLSVCLSFPGFLYA